MSIGEGGADGLEGGLAVEAAGRDDGADVGVDLGAPDRAEAVRHLAEDHRGEQARLSRNLKPGANTLSPALPA